MKNLACNVRNASEKAYFVSKVMFVMVLFLSRILVQFPYTLTTTMFVLIKNLAYRKKKKFYFSNIGRTNRLPRITVYILRHATRAISFTFILLLLIVLQICPSFIRLICTQTIPKHKEVPRLTEKIELICISDQRVSICAIP